MVVVQVREQDDVDLGHVPVHHEVTAPAKDPQPSAKQRVGEDPEAPDLQQDGRVAEPRRVYAVTFGRARVRRLVHSTTVCPVEPAP